MDDGRLLRRFADEGSQEAFAALTKRHLGLVYAVCRRELDSNEAAEDAAQAVFLLLAQKAKTLRAGPSLAGWLFQTARYASRNARTQAARRAHYEGKAAAMQSPPNDSAAWADIEPLLNSSLAALPARDREGVLLRFFQGLTFAEMGAVLGLSEDAARKRVGRALEKLRRFFDREGVTLPSAVLPALLSAHALCPAPDHLAEAVTATLAGSVPAQVSLITQGVLHSMKLVQLKLAAGAAALFIAGTTTYVLAQTGHAKPPADSPVSLDTLIIEGPSLSGERASVPKDAVMNSVLTGKVRYEDGRPAENVHIAAQIQSKALDDILDASKKRLGLTEDQLYHWSSQEREEVGNNTVTSSDGTYTLPVGSGIAYDVVVYDTTGKWVASAIEGASGPQNGTANLPDLVLTKGAIVTGTVTDGSGRPLPGMMIYSFGPHRPDSSSGFVSVAADQNGIYRLRVAPGVCRIYIGSGLSSSKDGIKTVTVAAGEVKTVDLSL